MPDGSSLETGCGASEVQIAASRPTETAQVSCSETPSKPARRVLRLLRLLRGAGNVPDGSFKAQ